MENLPAATSYASCSSLEESGWAQISSTRRSRPLAASGLPKTVASTPFFLMCGMSDDDDLVPNRIGDGVEFL